MLQSFSLHTPSEEVMQTIDSVMVDGTSMKLPTHCINSAGELEGFMLEVPSKAKGGILPINRTMFHGTSLYEVISKAGSFNADIMRLQQTVDIRDTMKELMQKIADNCEGKEAAFRCVPDNVDLLSSVGTDGSLA
jgi:hypothetical protein